MAQQHILVDPLNVPESLPSTSGMFQVGDDAASSAPMSQHSISDLDPSDNGMNSHMRRTNFRQEERDALVALVAEYLGVIDKGHPSWGGVSLHGRRQTEGLKAKAWEDIASRFNSNPNFSKREANQLRKCWMNMKTRSQFTLSQRRLLGLDFPNAMAKSRLGKRKGKSAFRLRTPTGTGGFFGASRYHSLKKTSLSRVNRSSSLVSQAKQDRSRPRGSQGYQYQQSAALTKLARKSKPVVQLYDLTQDAEYQGLPAAQELRGDPRVQFLQDTVHDGNAADHGRVVTMRVTQPEVRRLTPPEVRRSTAEIAQVGSNRIMTVSQTGDLNAVQRSFGAPELSVPSLDGELFLPRGGETGALGQGQLLNLQQQQQRIIRNVNRTRPTNAQTTSFAQIDTSYAQLSPQRMSNANIHAGEFLGRSVETRTGATQTTYTILDDHTATFGQGPQEFSTALDNSVSALMNPTLQELPQRTTLNEHAVGSNGFLSMGSMTTEYQSLEANGPLITNVTSVSSSEPGLTIHTPGESERSEEIPEVQIVIKTEDIGETDGDLDGSRPETSKKSRPQESDQWVHRSNQTAKITREDGFATRSGGLPEDLRGISPRESVKRAEASRPTHRQNTGIDRQENLPTKGQVGAKPVALKDDLCGRMGKASDVAEEKGKEDVEYVEDVDDMDVVGDNGSGSDDGFIDAESGNGAREISNLPGDAQDGSLNSVENGRGSSTLSVDAHAVGHPVGTSDSARDERHEEEERKARMDILLFEVQKAKEEAAMARCRRELLEVEIETARQQLELAQRRQEAEIDLIRVKIRQEKAKADKLEAGCHEGDTRKGEPEKGNT